ncbi:Endonuclease [Citrus sinensis]|uniref:Endonuclease n=1 Tax=Citrus sinensis TaxID=2711 RepID=A0ACB8HW51_CITSI|nr:Endonuclease [Citrus sinensis]
MANPSNLAQEGVVGVDVPPEPSCGRDGERTQGKTRGKSKAPSVDALEPHELRVVRAEVDEVRSDWAWHKRTLSTSSAFANSSDARRIDVPKPNTYDDTPSKVVTAPTYLRGAAQLWWRHKHGEMGKSICTIDTWNDFKQELRKQFALNNAEKEARVRLRRLKQSGSIQDYINEFTTLMLEINNMSDKDSLFYFQDGLKDWAKTELDRHGVQTLDDAIALQNRSLNTLPNPKTRSLAKAKHGFSPTSWRTQPPTAHTRQERAHACQRKDKRSVRSRAARHGATYNFVSVDEAKHLGLKGTKEGGTMKAMVLGMEFFDQVHVFPLPTTNSLSILDGTHIRPSKAPFGAPVLFQKKNDGLLRMCINYRALNKITIKNKYMIPLIADLFDQLGKARYFTKLDLRSGYYQVRIAKGDELKTACTTRYGSFEFLVMPFGLTNAPTTFCTLMNKVLQLFLDRFVVVYLDDIVVYSTTLEEHAQHLRQVLQVLRDNELFLKLEKCSFTQQEVEFLGHKIAGGKLMMKNAKVKVIIEWEPPLKVPELRSFLGLVNYYCRIIKGYSAKAAPLTDMLKKNRTLHWSEECQRAFEELKRAISEEPVLALPDHTKPFEVQTDASDFAIRGVLMQEGHPIAFESQKLNDTERRYTVQEKEMTAIIHCLRVWRHYLLGSHFTIMTDNVATSYFQTQKKLSPKQARCMSQPKSDLISRIKEGLQQDPLAKNLLENVLEGKTRQFWQEESILLTKGDRLFVPRWRNLRKEVIKECHDSKWAGHPGIERTTALVDHQLPARLLEPLSLATRPWESVSMDFITSLPKSERCGSIMVVVDQYSKYVTFIAAPINCKADEVARLFVKYIVKLWGVPKSIVSDRDPRFTGCFWTELFKMLGTDLKFSTSFHPQTDGQTERINGLLEMYLRHYRSEATGKSPFEIIMGFQPMTPNVIASTYGGKSPVVHKLTCEWHEEADITRAYFDKAARKMKKWADTRRRHIEYKEGDQVMIKLLHQQLKTLRKVHKGLVRRYEGPFRVVRRPYHEDMRDPSRGESRRAPTAVVTAFDKDVDYIIADRVVSRRGMPAHSEYLVKWKNLPESEVTWEREDDLWQFAEHIQNFKHESAMRTPRA